MVDQEKGPDFEVYDHADHSSIWASYRARPPEGLRRSARLGGLTLD